MSAREPVCFSPTDQCQLPLIHDESGPPRLHGAPLGNDNAEGNSGGGAPIRNFNAGTHGAWSDWRKHYDRLVGDAKEHIDELTMAYIEKSKADLSEDVRKEKARELAMRSHLWELAAAHVFEEGWGGAGCRARDRVWRPNNDCNEGESRALGGDPTQETAT